MYKEELIEKLKNEIHKNIELKEHLEIKKKENNIVQRSCKKIKRNCKFEDITELQFKFLNFLKEDRDEKLIYIKSDRFIGFNNASIESLKRCYRNFIIGTYISLTLIDEEYLYKDCSALKFEIKNIQDTIISYYTYKKLLKTLGEIEINIENNILDICLEFNLELISKIYGKIVTFSDKIINYNELIDCIDSKEKEIKSKLLKIHYIEDFEYLLDFISEKEYSEIKRVYSQKYSIFKKLFIDKDELMNQGICTLDNINRIKNILKESEKDAKKYIKNKYASQFRGIEIYCMKIDFLNKYEYMKEYIKSTYTGENLTLVFEIIKELLDLRVDSLKSEMATKRLNRKKSTLILELGKDYRDINDEIYNAFSLAFLYMFESINSKLSDDKKLNLKDFLKKDGFIDLISRRKMDFKWGTLNGFRNGIINYQLDTNQERLKAQNSDKSSKSKKIDDSNKLSRPVIKSFKIDVLPLNIEAPDIYFLEKNLEEKNCYFPNKIKMKEFDNDILKLLREKLVCSEEILEELIIDELEEDIKLSDVKIENLKKHFIKFSQERFLSNNFEFKYENEDLLLKEIRICFDLRLRYIKYKAISITDTVLCDKFDTEKFFLESILDRLDEILAKLIYCAIDMINEKSSSKNIDLERFIYSEEFMSFLTTTKCPNLQTLSYIEDIFDKITKLEVISQYLEKNPSEEYPGARAIKRKFIIHSGPTNSGKTYGAIEDLKMAKNGVYLAPLRLLAIEVQEKLLDSGVKCSLLTGEEEFNVDDETHISSTIEKTNFSKEFEVAVIDECQMIGDVDRGGSWTNAILGIKSKMIHLCTAPSSVNLLIELIKSCGDEYEVINHKRNTELLMDTEEFNDFSDCKKGDALIVFSKRNVLSVASALLNRGIKSSIIYGSLPYQTRKLQMEKFLNGETDVIVSTDAISMGLNLPIKRVVFIDSRKYDGYVKRKLFTEEVKQIAGRAGRYGIYDIGYVNALENYDEIKSKLNMPYWNIEKAKLNLPESIINIEGDLAENIKLWKEVDNLDGFEKSSVDREISMLKMIDDIGYSDIGNFYKYKLATMYFAENDKMTNLLFQNYLHLYFRELKDEMVKPNLIDYGSDLQSLESYYKSIELYYVFSKTFNLQMDLDWIREEKLTISERINSVLISEIKVHEKKCRVCGKELKWDSIDTICTRCALMTAFGKENSKIRLKIG